MTVTAPENTPVAEVPRSSGTRLVDRVFKMRELAILVVFLVMIVVTQLGNSEFLTEQGIKDLLLNATILVLVAVGLVQPEAEKSAGVNINLWAGIGMLVFAAAFLTWARLRPITVPEEPTES